MTSMYDCQVSKPLEQRSIARILQIGLSSRKYIEMDFDMSVRQLQQRQHSFQLQKKVCIQTLVTTSYISPQLSSHR